MTTLALNDDLCADVQRRRAAEGTTDAAVVGAALLSYLGPDGLIDRIHERKRDVSDEDVTALAYEELATSLGGRAIRITTTCSRPPSPRSVALVGGDKDLTTVDVDDVTVLTPAVLIALLVADDTPAAASPVDVDPSAGT